MKQHKIPAKGGSMGSAGPTVANEMLFVESGYGAIRGNPGNVLLALGAEQRRKEERSGKIAVTLFCFR